MNFVIFLWNFDLEHCFFNANEYNEAHKIAKIILFV